MQIIIKHFLFHVILINYLILNLENIYLFKIENIENTLKKLLLQAKQELKHITDNKNIITCLLIYKMYNKLNNKTIYSKIKKFGIKTNMHQIENYFNTNKYSPFNKNNFVEIISE